MSKSILVKKKETEAAVMSEVANPSSAPALIALNMFNAVKLEKLITCVNGDGCTLLFDMHI